MTSYCGKCQDAEGTQTDARFGFLCDACADEVQRDPDTQQTAQVVGADDILGRDPAAILSWPFASLDALAGPLPPGAVAYVAAFSGQGKTTFVTECTRRWLHEKRRVYYMPLEAEATEWRVRYACAELGIEPGDALSGRLRQREALGDPDAATDRERIREILYATRKRDPRHNLYVSPDPFLDFSVFARNVRLAAEWGYHVVVVDHIDHVRARTERGSATAASADIQYGALDLAKRHGVVLVLMSQVNLNAIRGNSDALAKYRPPREDHLFMSGAAKLQIATQVLGLYRPLRPDVTPDELHAAKGGDADPATVLATGRMGVVALKLRHYGSRTGQRDQLAYEHGQLRDLDVAERRDVEAASHRIHTNRNIA